MKSLIKSIIALSLVIVTRFYASAQVSIGVSVRTGPPMLPVYSKPLCPADGYMWVPGYWAYSDGGYYWVPGAWVLPPSVGLLWTPGYWGFSNGFYGWNQGYWGSQVGFYGGINYGFGYSGFGYGGGMWRGNAFHYNTAVTNVNTTVVHNTYVNKTVINNTTVANNRSSFNGPGGVTAKPVQQEQLAMKEQHVQPTSEQLSHEASARADRAQFASVNHGHPARLALASANDNNQVNNQQSLSTQPNNSDRKIYKDQTAESNNKNDNADSHIKENVQKQDKQANNNNTAQMKNEQMSNKDVKSQGHANQPQMKNQQMNAPKHQFQPHPQNMQRSNSRGNRHGK